MTWLKKLTTTMETREMMLEKLQPVIDEQSPMRFKPDSLIFQVKRKLQDHFVLLSRRHAGRAAHNATHVPFRDWCAICVASRGRSSPHRRVVVKKKADTLPKFLTDYMFIRTVEKSKTLPCITFVETRCGVVISEMCAQKGGFDDMTNEIFRHLEFLNPVIVQFDKEKSIIDL